MLVKRILPRAANISQILQIPLHFPKKRKKKEKKFDWTTIFFFFRSPDNFWSTWPAWNEHRFKTRASGGRGEGEEAKEGRVDCVSRQAAPLRARCAVTRHAPFTPIATNTCITAAVSKFPSSLHPNTLSSSATLALWPFYLERQPSATKRSDCFAEQYRENFIQFWKTVDRQQLSFLLF